MAAERAHPIRLPRPTARVYAAVGAVVLGVWVVVLQVRLTGYALADLMGALGSSPDEAAWVNTVYVVAELVAIPAAGWLSARLSTRRVFVPAALGFALVSLAATQVTHIDQLIVLRALQGFAGGVLIPLAVPTFRRKLPYRHRLVAFALYGVASSVPIGLAPLLEGLLVEELSWRFLFLPAAGLAALAALLGAWGLPEVPVERGRAWNPDWGGTLLLPAGLGLIVLGIDQANRLDWLDSRWVLGLVCAGLLTLVAFLAHARAHPRPYVGLKLLANRNYTLAIVTFLGFHASMIAVVWAVPDFLARVEQFRPIDFVDMFAAMIAPQLLVPFLVARASRRLDLRLVIAAGIAAQAVACLRTATLTSEWQAPELVGLFALHGVGQALFFTPILVLQTLELDESQRVGAVGVVNLVRVFANAVGVSVASTFVTQCEHHHHAMLVESLHPDGLGAQATLERLRALVVDHLGADEHGRRALALAAGGMRREAFVLAYGDLFLAIGVTLLGVLVLQALLAPVSLRELDPRRTRAPRDLHHADVSAATCTTPDPG